MTQSVLLVVITAVVTWLLMRWSKSAPRLAKLLSLEEKEAASVDTPRRNQGRYRNLQGLGR